MDVDPKSQALELFYRGYQAQVKGQLEKAQELYCRSIETSPTAEAYTFLGWTHSLMGRLDEAIDVCLKAIQVDSSLGNPYNDIGAYLIEKGCGDEAIPWLEKAISSKRYDSYHLPHMNLGRVWEHKGDWTKALSCYRKALELNKEYQPAAKALASVRGKLN